MITPGIEFDWALANQESGWYKKLEPNWYFAVLTGSRAFGVQGEESDVDIQVVRMSSEKEIFRGDVEKTSRFSTGHVDASLHSVHKFLRILSKSDPMALLAICREDLVIDGAAKDDSLWHHFRRHAHGFMSTRVAHAAIGMSRAATTPKEARIVSCALQVALSILETRDITEESVRASLWHRPESNEAQYDRMGELREEVQEAVRQSSLRDRVPQETIQFHMEHLTRWFLAAA